MLILKSDKKGPITKKRGTKQIFRDINTKKYFLKLICCIKIACLIFIRHYQFSINNFFIYI